MLQLLFVMLQDDDECSDGTDNCSTTVEICNNTSGGFTCDCQYGFVGDEYNCVGMKLLSIVTCWCLDLNNKLFEFVLHFYYRESLSWSDQRTAQLTYMPQYSSETRFIIVGVGLRCCCCGFLELRKFLC